jgi:L-rhamnose mutarotase
MNSNWKQNDLIKYMQLFVLIVILSGCLQVNDQTNVTGASNHAAKKEIVMMVNLKNDSSVIQRYEAYHAAKWPEVTEASKAAGFEKINIYRLGNRIVMVLTVPENWDAEEGSQRYLSYSPRVKEWVDTMAAMQEVSPEAPEGSEGWTPMKRIYSFDARISKELHR